jgi:X-Pro dipeptidyl-peptidase
VRIVSALKGRVPVQVYFHQGGHGGAPPLELTNRWFTRFLYGVDNGVERDPKSWIVREGEPPEPVTDADAAGARGRGGRGRGRGATPPPVAYPDYPHPDAADVALHPGAGGPSRGTLGFVAAAGTVVETLVDNVEFDGPSLALAESSPHRLLYATPELATAVHISGTPRITIRLASTKPAANLSAYLVVLPWLQGRIGPHNLITRGWADPQNHASLTRGGNYDSTGRGEPLVPGSFYTLTFDLQPDDQIIAAGKRIGLMILSSDREFTLWPAPGTELSVDLTATRVTLPVVGGRAALERALDGGARSPGTR